MLNYGTSILRIYNIENIVVTCLSSMPMCKSYGVNWHLWNINERQSLFLNEFSYVMVNLDNCVRSDHSAEDCSVKNKYKLKIDEIKH